MSGFEQPKENWSKLPNQFVDEIMPEIKLPAFKKLKVTRQVTSIDDVAVTSMLDKFRTQHGEWHAVERAAQMGDQVNLDYVGKLKGEPFEGGTAQDAELELGTGQFIEGFEKYEVVNMIPLFAFS